MVTDPSDPATLYISVAFDGVYRMTGATSGTVGNGLTPVKLGSFPSPGPVAFGLGGRLFVATEAVGVPPRLSMSADQGDSWRDVDDDRYRATALFPRTLTFAPDGTLYVALRGDGVLVETPLPAS